jgi:DNA-binding XRE family transcriptional regulator
MTTLKRLREAAGLTREEFAEQTGINRFTLEKHEQGVHRIPLDNARTYAVSLAKAMDATPSRLLGQLAGLESA